MKPPIFIAALVLSALFGGMLGWNLNKPTEVPPMDPRLVSTLDSLKAEDARKDTLINALMNAPPVTIRIREQLPTSAGLGLDSLKHDLMKDPQ